jgi:hypothetical protein
MYTLDEKEALEAMGYFLRAYYDRGHHKESDLPLVMHSIEILSDGITADPAAWDDWLDAIRKVKEPEG